MKIKQHLNPVKKWYKKYFIGKTIIHTYGFAPAVLEERLMHRGVKMLRIAFTNLRVQDTNKIPMTFVRLQDVHMMRRMPCLFVKNVYAAFGKRAKGRTYKIAHK